MQTRENRENADVESVGGRCSSKRMLGLFRGTTTAVAKEWKPVFN